MHNPQRHALLAGGLGGKELEDVVEDDHVGCMVCGEGEMKG